MEFFDNIVMLGASVAGLLVSLFRFIERPKRGWLYITAFFLAHILSDYYWTVYTLVIHDSPEVSAFMAYFGWNVGYVLLIFAVPLCMVIGGSFFNYRLMPKTFSFNGIGNYIQLFTQDKNFWLIFRNTLVWIVIHCVFHVALGTLLAFVLYKKLVLTPSV